MKRLATIIFTITLLYALPSVGAKPLEIEWGDLVPKMEPQEDPLATLSVEEADEVEWIIYLRQFLPEEETPDLKDYFDELQKALPELKAKGIDVDAIIAQRKYKNNAANEELNGKLIKMAGYLLPLDLSGKAVTDFLLVPYVGACIHVPPPPPNQIVHAVSATPSPYELEELFKPVSVTGILEVKSLSKELFLTDGSSDISIGYTMSVEKIEGYTP